MLSEKTVPRYESYIVTLKRVVIASFHFISAYIDASIARLWIHLICC